MAKGRKKQAEAARGPGRPAHSEPVERVNVILTRRQIASLDRMAADIREAGGVLKRTEIVRGILEAVTMAGINFTSARNEEDIRSILASKIKPAR
jgi:hypothetical protein